MKDTCYQHSYGEQGRDLRRGCGERVLVADDDPACLHCIGEMLVHIGYDVRRAGDSAEARAIICSPAEAVDLIVADPNMSGMSGPELAMAVRMNGRRVPVILTAGCCERIPSCAAFKDDDVRVMHKPMGIRDLSIVVDQMLQGRLERRK
jgi:DNA-binding NtrC family response regulator